MASDLANPSDDVSASPDMEAIRRKAASIDLGKVAQVCWLLSCHGHRFESEPAKPVVKPGTKTLYLAEAH